MTQAVNYFTEAAIKTAGAIVRVFETGRALGDYSAIAVLDDAAGISYGIKQFTHRSGSLEAVVKAYLRSGGIVGANVLGEHIGILESRTSRAIKELASDSQFKAALKAAGVTSEMRAAQEAVAFERYMLPAIRACEGSAFVLPLSLAVIHDSITHGSYERIRDEVTASASDEKAWITEYVRRRHAWLSSVARLRKTNYRTQFFLNQIMTGTWDLRLPLNVRGVMLTNALLDISTAPAVEACTAVGPAAASHTSSLFTSDHLLETPASNPSAQQPLSGEDTDGFAWETDLSLDDVETRINAAAEKFDRIERMAWNVIDRTDRAKSLWTTVAATAWQTLWAVFGFLSGLPREVWFVVAGITAATMLFYLYRQIALGKIREREQADLLERC